MKADTPTIEEMQSRVCHWNTLKYAATRDHGPDDELTKFYASMLAKTCSAARALNYGVDHLVSA